MRTISSLASSLLFFVGLMACQTPRSEPSPQPSSSSDASSGASTAQPSHAPAPLPGAANPEQAAQPGPETPSPQTSPSASAPASPSASSKALVDSSGRAGEAGSRPSTVTPQGTRDGGTAGARGGCASDSDCRTISSTCGDCTCKAGLRGAVEPKCTRGQVQCFVDPCRNARAFCKAGSCVVANDGAM